MDTWLPVFELCLDDLLSDATRRTQIQTGAELLMMMPVSVNANADGLVPMKAESDRFG
jgi:hypothetical protein